MFTGIVEETGIVESVDPSGKAIKLSLRAKTSARGLRIGDSVAVNGCCLTVVNLVPRARERLVQFDLLRETWERTNLQFVRSGTRVNLERSLPANGRLGGHFVTGHIDELGKVIHWKRSGQDYDLEITASADLMPYVVFKGSIAVDGISLTVAEVHKKSFRVWIIPHTFEVTALRERKVGDKVNLEADILAKYVERILNSRQKE